MLYVFPELLLEGLPLVVVAINGGEDDETLGLWLFQFFF